MTEGKRARPRLRWYVNGVIIIIGSLALMAYLGFIQASQAYHEASGSLQHFQIAFVNSTIKSTLLILAAGVFVFFFSIQDYQMTIEKLMERLTESIPENNAVNPVLKPGRKGATLLSPTTHAEGLTAISQSVKTIIEEKEMYIEQLVFQEQQIRETLVVRLMKGWVKNDLAAIEICQSHGLLIHHTHIQVLVFGTIGQVSPLPGEKTQAAYQSLKEIIQAFTRDLYSTFCVEIDGMLAILLTPLKGNNLLDPTTKSDFLTIIKLSLQMVYEESGSKLRASIGSVFTGIPGVAHSYAEAVEALQYTNLIGEDTQISTFSTENREESSEPYASTQELEWLRSELQFMNRIDTGDFNGALVLFNTMLDASSTGATASELVRFRMLSLSNMVITAIGRAQLSLGGDSLDYPALCDCITSSGSLPELRKSVQKVFEVLDDLSQVHKSQSIHARMKSVADFVHQNYQDQNLTVAMAASHFGLNPSYLSRTFKRVMNVGLAAYIQHVRVEAAKELLRDKQMSVKKAAETVGFSNALTMNRAFHRQEGTTAGQLRRTNDSS